MRKALNDYAAKSMNDFDAYQKALENKKSRSPPKNCIDFIVLNKFNIRKMSPQRSPKHQTITHDNYQMSSERAPDSADNSPNLFSVRKDIRKFITQTPGIMELSEEDVTNSQLFEQK